MALSDNVQNVVSKVIADLGTEVTILRVTPTKNSYGSVTSYEITGTGTVKCVPSSYIKRGLNQRPFGQLNEGETRMLFPAGTAYTSLKGTADSWRVVMGLGEYTGTYIPTEERPIMLQGAAMAYPVVLALEEEDGY